MIDNNTKEELIERILNDKNVKKSQSYKNSAINPQKKNVDETNKTIHGSENIEFDGELIEGARFTQQKNSIVARNCVFRNLQFRELTCPNALFVNCEFEDFDIISSNLKNITFIACDFKRFSVRGSVTYKTDLTGMKLVRCKFDNTSNFKSAILEESQWLDTDINSVDIDRDEKSVNGCRISHYIGDDIREKSVISNDVSTEIKNVDIKTLEKGVVADREYSGETIDISLFVNSDFCNCKFIGCNFVDDIFRENELINFEMRSAFINCVFESCEFNCQLKGIRFDNCSFTISHLNGYFISCIFANTKFLKCELTPCTIMNYSIFINCDYEATDLSILNNHVAREVKGDVGVVYCEQVETIKNIIDLENNIADLKKEKEDANTQLYEVTNELENVRRAVNDLGNEIFQKDEVIKNINEEKNQLEQEIDETIKEKLNMDQEMEIKEEEIKELAKKLEVSNTEKAGLEEKIKEMENTIEQLQSSSAQNEESYEELTLLKAEKGALENRIAELQNANKKLLDQIDEQQRKIQDGTSSINNEELVMDIVNLIKEKIGIDLVEEKPVDENATVEFLATLSEEERLNVFSKAAALRMKNAMMGNM